MRTINKIFLNMKCSKPKKKKEQSIIYFHHNIASSCNGHSLASYQQNSLPQINNHLQD